MRVLLDGDTLTGSGGHVLGDALVALLDGDTLDCSVGETLGDEILLGGDMLGSSVVDALGIAVGWRHAGLLGF